MYLRSSGQTTESSRNTPPQITVSLIVLVLVYMRMRRIQAMKNMQLVKRIIVLEQRDSWVLTSSIGEERPTVEVVQSVS